MKNLHTYLSERLKINKDFVPANDFINDIVGMLLDNPEKNDTVYEDDKTLNLVDCIDHVLIDYFGGTVTVSQRADMSSKIFRRFKYLPTAISTLNFETAILKINNHSNSVEKSEYDIEISELYNKLQSIRRKNKNWTVQEPYEYYNDHGYARYVTLAMSNDYMIMFFHQTDKYIRYMLIVKFK